MYISLNWLKKYIALEHTPEEIGDILTNLEFLQNGPIKEFNNDQIIDIEVKPNRPDALSMIGIAREYSAYVNRPISEPKKIETSKLEIPWGTPEINLSVEDTSNVKRYCTVELTDIQIAESPDWIKQDLKSYGMDSINNVVDITNYVMLEYGIPMHAFDKSKLATKANCPLLTIRKADSKENFVTWQNTNISLTTKDTVVCDAEKPVGIAGVIGGANSDIDPTTSTIILEAACYNQASIRRTILRHNVRTEGSSRHEKFLSPLLVVDSIQRALYLLQEYAGAKVVRIEDYFANTEDKREIEFNVNEINRLSGISIETEKVVELLKRLGFEVIEHKEAVGIDLNILLVKVPNWRTDINQDADLVEEVLRLYGYKNIPLVPLNSSAPDYGTPKTILLDDLIKDLLVQCGLYEHILSPFVKINSENTKQIRIENPLNKDNEALRTSIRESLNGVSEYYIKSGLESFGIFESGKIYIKEKEGQFTEKKQIETMYYNSEFSTTVKPNFLFVLKRLGINTNELEFKEASGSLLYSLNGTIIGKLSSDGFILYLEDLAEIVDIGMIPYTSIKHSFTQKIIEDITLLVPVNQMLGVISKEIHDTSEYIKHVVLKTTYKEADDSKFNSVTFEILFEDILKQLTREKIEELRTQILTKVKKFKAVLKS